MTDGVRHIVVLGAGVAGLAAAHRFLELRPGSRVTVLEEGSSPGGLASSWKLGRFRADLGPHRVYTELPEIRDMLPELISSEELLTVERRSEMLIDGHFYKYPISAPELLRKMGPIKTARMAAGMVQGKAWAVKGGAPRNYEEAMIRGFGRGVYDMIIGPYTKKVWKIEPAELDEEVARVRVSAGNAARLMSQWFSKSDAMPPTSLKEFTYIRGGVQGLVDNLQQKVESAGGVIRTNCIATGFQGSPGHITEVVTHNCTAPVYADAVISTVPITDLTEMVAGSFVGYREDESANRAMAAAGELEFVGLMLVAIIVNRPQVTPNSWIYFPEEHLSFNRAYEPGNFDASMKPDNQSMLVFEVTARWDSPIWRQSNADVIEQVTREAVSTGVFSAEDVNDAAAVRVPHAYPLYRAGFRETLDSVCGYLRSVKNLVSTGRQGLFNHNNMDHSMLMGIRAAEAVAEDADCADKWYGGLDQFAHFRIVD